MCAAISHIRTKEELYEEGDYLGWIDATKTAEQAKPGKTVEGNMGKDDGRVVDKIEILDGKTRIVSREEGVR